MRRRSASSGAMGEERKGFSVFAQAAQIVHQRYPNARFLVAGDGQEEGEKILDSLGASEQLKERFEFLGRISDDDKARFYAALSMYVAPQTEGRASASCWRKPWRPAVQRWRRTSTRSARSPSREKARRCSSTAMRRIAHVEYANSSRTRHGAKPCRKRGCAVHEISTGTPSSTRFCRFMQKRCHRNAVKSTRSKNPQSV